MICVFFFFFKVFIGLLVMKCYRFLKYLGLVNLWVISFVLKYVSSYLFEVIVIRNCLFVLELVFVYVRFKMLVNMVVFLVIVMLYRMGLNIGVLLLLLCNFMVMLIIDDLGEFKFLLVVVINREYDVIVFKFNFCCNFMMLLILLM